MTFDLENLRNKKLSELRHAPDLGTHNTVMTGDHTLKMK